MATMKETIRAILNGEGTPSSKLKAIGELVSIQPRCDFVRENYTVDPTLRFVFSKRTGKKVNTMVHAGEHSPVPVDRAIWFILKGDDPAMVGRDREGGMYAIYETGGNRVYA